jgi:Phophatidylserine decarboxylase
MSYEEPGKAPILVPHRLGGWLPTNHRTLEAWLTKKIDEVSKHKLALLPVIEDFKELIEGNPIIYMGFHEMFDQVPTKPPYNKQPDGKPQVSLLFGFTRIFSQSRHRSEIMASCWNYSTKLFKRPLPGKLVTSSASRYTPLSTGLWARLPASRCFAIRGSTQSSKRCSTYGRSFLYRRIHVTFSTRTRAVGSALRHWKGCRTLLRRISVIHLFPIGDSTHGMTSLLANSDPAFVPSSSPTTTKSSIAHANPGSTPKLPILKR